MCRYRVGLDVKQPSIVCGGWVVFSGIHRLPTESGIRHTPHLDKIHVYNNTTGQKLTDASELSLAPLNPTTAGPPDTQNMLLVNSSNTALLFFVQDHHDKYYPHHIASLHFKVGNLHHKSDIPQPMTSKSHHHTVLDLWTSFINSIRMNKSQQLPCQKCFPYRFRILGHFSW